MITGPRTIKATVGLFERVSTFEEARDLDDDHLLGIIRSVAHYNQYGSPTVAVDTHESAGPNSTITPHLQPTE